MVGIYSSRRTIRCPNPSMPTATPTHTSSTASSDGRTPLGASSVPSEVEERSMRAWQVVKHGEPNEVMELGEKPVPEPGSGEVRIVVKAVALGLPDVFMCRGTY